MAKLPSVVTANVRIKGSERAIEEVMQVLSRNFTVASRTELKENEDGLGYHCFVVLVGGAET